MKKIILFLLFIFSFTSFVNAADWMYLVNKDQFGAITKTSTYEDLINLFGKEKLKDETHTGPEGEGILKCTIVYKGTSQEITVYWQDKKFHNKISRVECTKANSPYHTSDDLKIGSSLNDVVKANKAFITFYGFGWDYGGAITNYNKGNLEKSKIIFTLNCKGNDISLLGDREFNSKMPNVIKMAKQIYIAKIEVSFS